MQRFVLTPNQVLDNIQYFRENSERDYCATIKKIIASDPFDGEDFYIFSFVKRVDDARGIKKMYHQPRLTRPAPLPGTTLLRVKPTDPESAIIIWTLPNQENFQLYKSGKMFADSFVWECIQQYEKDPAEMIRPDPKDLSDDKIREIYTSLCRRKRQARRDA
jgi:hypothetical protein